MIKIGLASLGCPKNQVDAEILLSILEKNGYQLVEDPCNADVVFVNTCGFIQSAKEEAIEQILEFVQWKKQGLLKKIVVTGCLAERYREQLMKEIPEIDAVVGIGSNQKIVEIMDTLLNSSGRSYEYYGEKEDLPLSGDRILTTPSYFAYLKIAEGCDHQCSYCAIPNIRGKFRSRPIESLVEEAIWLAKQGVVELILVAQDTTCYGEDLYGSYQLTTLLKQLCNIEQIQWIRLLYCYPDKITDELIDLIAEQQKIVNYMDLPLQHANDDILKKMNRPGNQFEYRELIKKLRKRIPDITLRTTMIAGFPTETEEQFTELAEFVQQVAFDRLGCFSYSEEEDTAAVLMTPQIPKEVRQHRAELIMQEQMMVMQRKNHNKIGQTMIVLTEGYDPISNCYFGRSQSDAPEIDGKIFFSSGSNQSYQLGEFVNVCIKNLVDDDLFGDVVASS